MTKSQSVIHKGASYVAHSLTRPVRSKSKRLVCSKSQTKLPSSKWQLLPQSILSIILDFLESQHVTLQSTHAEHELRYDLMSVQCICRMWFVEAQKRLYRHIRIHERETATLPLRDEKMLGRSIILLRRTLRKRPMLAMLVKHIHISIQTQSGMTTKKNGQTIPTSYPDLVASLVMACPDLEKLTGVQPLYAHEFDKLVYALSTRSKLNRHSWLIGENRTVTSRARSQRPPGILSPTQVSEFLGFHSRWRNLETLRVASFHGRGIVEQAVLVQALNSLPSLKHLTVVDLDADDFTNDSLLALPPLESLNVEGCAGVTDAGICQWVRKSTAKSIRELALLRQNLVSLLTISTLLACLTNLEAFRISQGVELSLPLALPIRQPLLASDSLVKLRWEISRSRSTMELLSRSQNVTDRHVSPKSTRSDEPSISSQHLILSLLQHGLPRCDSIQLDPNQNFTELMHWAHEATTRTNRGMQVNPPDWTVNPSTEDHCDQSVGVQPRFLNTETCSWKHPEEYQPPVELEANLHKTPSSKSLANIRSSSFQQRYRGPKRTYSSRSQHDSTPMPNRVPKTSGSTSSEQSMATTRSTRTASLTASTTTTASSMSQQTLSNLQPIAKAEDTSMGFQFGFVNAVESLPPCPQSPPPPPPRVSSRLPPPKGRFPIKIPNNSEEKRQSAVIPAYHPKAATHKTPGDDRWNPNDKAEMSRNPNDENRFSTTIPKPNANKKIANPQSVGPAAQTQFLTGNANAINPEPTTTPPVRPSDSSINPIPVKDSTQSQPHTKKSYEQKGHTCDKKTIGLSTTVLGATNQSITPQTSTANTDGNSNDDGVQMGSNDSDKNQTNDSGIGNGNENMTPRPDDNDEATTTITTHVPLRYSFESGASMHFRTIP